MHGDGVARLARIGRGQTTLAKYLTMDEGEQTKKSDRYASASALRRSMVGGKTRSRATIRSKSEADQRGGRIGGTSDDGSAFIIRQLVISLLFPGGFIARRDWGMRGPQAPRSCRIWCRHSLRN